MPKDPRGSIPPPGPAYIRLSRTFYLRSTLTIARDLPGKFLMRRLGSVILAGRIVEVEAYLGTRDPASHAYRGMTMRNQVMFAGGGHLYVYFTYGMHFCCNVVTEGKGSGCAVLLRAVEPVEGIDVMRDRRRGKSPREKSDVELCNGPGKLCQAFGISRSDNGRDLCGEEIWIARKEDDHPRPPVSRSVRIGISRGRDRPWRFFFRNNAFVSPGTRGD